MPVIKDIKIDEMSVELRIFKFMVSLREKRTVASFAIIVINSNTSIGGTGQPIFPHSQIPVCVRRHRRLRPPNGMAGAMHESIPRQEPGNEENQRKCF